MPSKYLRPVPSGYLRSGTFMYSRKRTRPTRGFRYTSRAKKRSVQRRRLFRAGYDRTGGFYGRFTSGGERKFLDVTVDDGVVAIGANVQDASGQEIVKVPEGNGESNRVGRKIVVTDIMMKGVITILSTETQALTSDSIRILLVQDLQCNGAQPSDTDILETATFNSWRNLANSGRFKILMDQAYPMQCASGGGSTGTVYGESKKQISFYKKCHIPIEYDNSATTGAVATVRSNNLVLMYCSDTGNCSIVNNVRIRYTDH